MGSLQRILEKYHMEKWFSRENLIVLVLMGVLLVVIVIPIKEPEAEEKTVAQKTEENVPAQTAPAEYEKCYAYAAYLEKELEEIL